MGKKKKKKKKKSSRVAPVIIGAILVICCMLPVSANLFGRTGYVTEITNIERIGGRLDEPGLPNAYKWTVGYKFRMENGKIDTGSVTVTGDAVSSKSGIHVGSPIRYLAFYPGYNTPGEGKFDLSTIMFLLTAAFGVFMISLGVRKPKPSKTPAQRSREYRAAKAAQENPPPAGAKPSASHVKPMPPKTMPQTIAKKQQPMKEQPENYQDTNRLFCENCGVQLNAGAMFCRNCGASQQPAQAPQQAQVIEPNWDLFWYDNETPVTEAEADELYSIATEEEIHEEFDLINAIDEGPAYCRKVLAIVRWRRANGY